MDLNWSSLSSTLGNFKPYQFFHLYFAINLMLGKLWILFLKSYLPRFWKFYPKHLLADQTLDQGLLDNKEALFVWFHHKKLALPLILQLMSLWDHWTKLEIECSSIRKHSCKEIQESCLVPFATLLSYFANALSFLLHSTIWVYLHYLSSKDLRLELWFRVLIQVQLKHLEVIRFRSLHH